MKKKIILAVSLVTLVTLSACGSKSTDLQDKIKDKGKIVVAVSPDYAPFEFKALVNGKDKIVGSDIELAQNIADELGVKLELSSMSFNNVLSSLQTKKSDIAISGLSYTKERAKVYDFSKPYYETENAVLILKKDSATYTNKDSLKGKKVAVLKGTIEETLSKEQFKGANIVSLTNMGEAINELKTGHVQAVDLEGPVAEGYIAQNSDITKASFHLKVSDGDAKAIAIPKGNKKLKKSIDKVITKLKKSDKYQTYIKDAAQLTGKATE
ncbi:hypothetical protein HMPREF9318_00687 [Streptococcus urinalis FB127-CNA-2]|uniref:transporter substrate-binding domain-containing protein n=1 Tax=Streptococcus urinalis TaxID=149016 RepID=UPI000225C831|nr:transporter substrate-binding domain-containing protein [Streptococcus urinalis]EKS22489.1 hypothetical protein HMPREF9318_00687 [Streptococcus urinalis FB127-CNA-2]VEF32302.1 Amino acid ABC transporter, amino acid-binding protein [Streptococcus urinalis]